MAGNVFEWVQDRMGPYPDVRITGAAQESTGSPYRIMRGGGRNSNVSVRTTKRTFHTPTFSYSGSGARCVR